MDIQEAMKQRRELELKIAELLQNFNVETGLTPTSIDFSVIDVGTIGEPAKTELWVTDIRVNVSL